MHLIYKYLLRVQNHQTLQLVMGDDAITVNVLY